MTVLTLLRARRGLLLAKRWCPDGNIVSAARAAWFEAKEIPVDSLARILAVLGRAEKLPRVALVKEAIAQGANSKRLRRRCRAGVDQRTGERYCAGLQVVPQRWIVLDIEGLRRPEVIDWRDGEALAAHARGLLPGPFRNAGCVWQFSGSSGHPSKRNEIRLHLFFMLDEPLLPAVWKPYLAHLDFVDRSVFDQAKIIFTAAPVVLYGNDPLGLRHGILVGEPIVRVPKNLLQCTELTARPDLISNKPARHQVKVDSQTSLCRRTEPRRSNYVASAPLQDAAAVFVEIVSRSNILRSRHPAYRSSRSRRLAFCSILHDSFGIRNEAMLLAAFKAACVGKGDPDLDHDGQQALAWSRDASSAGQMFSVRKLLCDASVALREADDRESATRAARLAMLFAKIEARRVAA